MMQKMIIKDVLRVQNWKLLRAAISRYVKFEVAIVLTGI